MRNRLPAVVLLITIDSDGKVSAAKVLSGPGYGMEEAALESIYRFKFKPAVKDGEPVATGRLRIKVRRASGEVIDHLFATTQTWAKRNNDWRQVSFHASFANPPA